MKVNVDSFSPNFMSSMWEIHDDAWSCGKLPKNLVNSEGGWFIWEKFRIFDFWGMLSCKVGGGKFSWESFRVGGPYVCWKQIPLLTSFL